MKEESIQKFEDLYKNEYYIPPSKSDLQTVDAEFQSSDEESSDNEVDFMCLYRPALQIEKQGMRQKTQDHWRSEIDQYTKSDISNANTDILEWWEKHEQVYPDLSRMARDLLSIQATSVSLERIFSRSSLIIRKHRNKLSKGIARELLCLNDWTKKEEFSIIKSVNSHM